MPKINCAIYTRKSTEHGLDMEFNSLQNQEEACKAYILSQAFNNWEYYKTYSDGGISGGTMERPGLQNLLNDIRAGQIQVVVVYKVDRLSRSIIDFHKMMQEFDKYGCNFVSITQSFDTSNSMGKLTLNMLLSFAQFEREVSAERVRDKIAASKAKGLWMGGCPPLGYKIVERQLIPEESEVPVIRLIFDKYLELGNMAVLAQWLNEQGYHTKKWFVKGGRTRGGKAFKESSVRRILSNPVYIGQIAHLAKQKVYKGKHQGIVDPEVYNRVQAYIHRRVQARYNIIKEARKPALLFGKLYDEQGHKFNLASSNKKNGQKVRYYYNPLGGSYLPLEQVNQFVINACKQADWSRLDQDADTSLLTEENIKGSLLRVICNRTGRVHQLKIVFDVQKLNVLLAHLPRAVRPNKNAQLPVTYAQENCWIKAEFMVDNVSSVRLQHGTSCNILTIRQINESLVRGLAKGWHLKKLLEQGMTTQEWEKASGMNKRTFARYLNLCYLSPKIVTDILEYRNPKKFTLRALMDLAESYSGFSEQEKEWNMRFTTNS